MTNDEYRSSFLGLTEEFRKTNKTPEFVACSSALATEILAVNYGIILGNSDASAAEFLERCKERLDKIKGLFGGENENS
jgi:hypothetical protein